MINRAAIQTKVDNWITTNGTRSITGAQLHEILTDILNDMLSQADDGSLYGIVDYYHGMPVNKDQAVNYNGIIIKNEFGAAFVSNNFLNECSDGKWGLCQVTEISSSDADTLKLAGNFIRFEANEFYTEGSNFPRNKIQNKFIPFGDFQYYKGIGRTDIVAESSDWRTGIIVDPDNAGEYIFVTQLYDGTNWQTKTSLNM